MYNQIILLSLTWLGIKGVLTSINMTEIARQHTFIKGCLLMFFIFAVLCICDMQAYPLSGFGYFSGCDVLEMFSSTICKYAARPLIDKGIKNKNKLR